MNTDIHSLLPEGYADHSRVWIYQSSRAFLEREQLEIQEQINQFTSQWQAHGHPVQGWGSILFGHFIVLMADESKTQVSGCSTDSSVRLIKSLERQYAVSLFDRLTLAFWIKGTLQLLPISQLSYAMDTGYIQEDTLFFNNAVLTKQEMEKRWILPLKESWLSNRIHQQIVP